MSTTFLDTREANRRDLPALIELYQHLAEGDEQPSLDLAEEVFERFKAYEGSAIIVGQTAGVLAASCTLIVVPNLTRGGRPYGLIENVVTHSDFRNRGFGKQVLLQAVDLAWKADCYKAMLMTGSKKRETLDFYLGAGFEQSKTGFQMRRVAARHDD
ncbi:GNAT family N-acetyltransferase [Rhizobium sullae]|uniref:GNAT family N-acetyltransferase n=1 Tax=Rhizobium sullae TaxID=50338 RepID=A0A2N0DAX3_RHISU|nr:GNAT family N-acetyltransferase [Rhizobium sullae]PKA43229.1 GNAT family N-acetyltransferase [Rhizobium sullae]